jgi:hypothetical protein
MVQVAHDSHSGIGVIGVWSWFNFKLVVVPDQLTELERRGCAVEVAISRSQVGNKMAPLKCKEVISCNGMEGQAVLQGGIGEW